MAWDSKPAVKQLPTVQQLLMHFSWTSYQAFTSHITLKRRQPSLKHTTRHSTSYCLCFAPRSCANEHSFISSCCTTAGQSQHAHILFVVISSCCAKAGQSQHAHIPFTFTSCCAMAGQCQHAHILFIVTFGMARILSSSSPSQSEEHNELWMYYQRIHSYARAVVPSPPAC